MEAGLEPGAWRRLSGIFLCLKKSEQFLVVASVSYCLVVLPFLVILSSSSISVLGQSSQYTYISIFQLVEAI